MIADGEWHPTRWWRAVGPSGDLWCESSDEDEVKRMARPTDTIQRLWAQTKKEWVTQMAMNDPENEPRVVYSICARIFLNEQIGNFETVVSEEMMSDALALKYAFQFTDQQVKEELAKWKAR